MMTQTYRPAKFDIKRLTSFCAMAMLCFAISSCMKRPVFIKVESVKIGSLKDSVLQTFVNFKVYNPNSVKSYITASNIKTYYKDKLVGSSVISNEVALPAKDTVIIPLVSSINLWNLAGVFPEILASDSATFRIEGDNKVKALGINWNIPVKDNIKLNIKQEVIAQVDETFKSNANFKIKEVKLTQLPGLNKTAFHVVVQVKNSFPFDYSLLNMDLAIYRKNGTNPIAHWKLTDTIAQKAGAVANIPISIEVDNLNVLSEVRLSDILHPNMEILLKGEAVIGIGGHTFTVPVEETTKISLSNLTGLNF